MGLEDWGGISRAAGFPTGPEAGPWGGIEPKGAKLVSKMGSGTPEAREVQTDGVLGATVRWATTDSGKQPWGTAVVAAESGGQTQSKASTTVDELFFLKNRWPADYTLAPNMR